MDSQKGRLILGGIVLVVLAAAVVFMYREELFGGSDSPPTNPNAAAVNNAVGAGGQPEPDAPNPAPRGSGRMAAPGR